MGELLRLESLYSGWEWSRCTVIAGNWRYLAPVRAFRELNGTPAQMADERIPSFWRLRETRAFVAWLRAREPRVVDGGDLRECGPTPGRPIPGTTCCARPSTSTRWRPGAASCRWITSSNGWLEPRCPPAPARAATGHRPRRQGTGVQPRRRARRRLGDRRDPNEDLDAPRRLYYVAMTRAQWTLALARFDGPHPLQDALIDHPSVARREPVTPPAASPELLISP